MNKHSNADLKQMQSLPLDVKVRMTKRRIEQWYDYWDGNVYVSRSGGKDSDVLGYIVKEMYSDVPQVFVNTGLEFDSVREHAEKECDIVLRPEMSFLQVITKYGYPVISKEVALKIYETKNKPNGYASQSFDENSKKTKKYPQFSMANYKYLLNAPFRISHKCCDYMKKKPSKKYEKENLITIH